MVDQWRIDKAAWHAEAVSKRPALRAELVIDGEVRGTIEEVTEVVTDAFTKPTCAMVVRRPEEYSPDVYAVWFVHYREGEWLASTGGYYRDWIDAHLDFASRRAALYRAPQFTLRGEEAA